MEQRVATYKTKIELVLELFLHNSCEIVNDECLQRLLAHLCRENKTETRFTLPIFTRWITRAVDTWSASGFTPSTNLVSFTLNLASLLMQNEDRFLVLNRNGFFLKLVNVAKVRQLQTEWGVRVAYIRLLSSFLQHSSGVEWIITSDFWQDVLDWSLNNCDSDVVDDSILFMEKLLEKSYDFNGGFCDLVVKAMMLPLDQNLSRCITVSGDERDEIALELLPTLKLIADVLEGLLKGVYREDKEFGVVFLFLKNFRLEERISNLLVLTESNIFFGLAKIMFMMQFLQLYNKTVTHTIPLMTINTTLDQIRSNFISYMYKGTSRDQLDFFKFGIFFWKLIDSKIPTFRLNPPQQGSMDFSDQLVVLLIKLNYCILLKHIETLGDLYEQCINDDLRNEVAFKVINSLSTEVYRVCFFWRDTLIEHPELFLITSKSLNLIKEIRTYLTRDQAVLMFRSFIYHVLDFVRVTKEKPQKLDAFLKQPGYMRKFFEVIGILIENFYIGLKDGIETSYVMSACFDFLGLGEWSSEVVVQVLKLVNVGIERYLAPNLVLLVENSPDSTLVLLGPLLFNKLREGDLEVQKAALEVVYTTAGISRSKFPSLQKVLMDSELPTLVVKMSTCDGESFVRATAIKCLQEMIQVEEIWNNALKTEDLTQKMRDILVNETEGIVRVEAATFMCVAYEHQQFPRDTLDKIYETMIYSSTTDLHWEVKVRALGFWDKVIKNHLQNQGMIDGSFPNVTFSKEHRKIVTLTDSEIRKRLLKVLGQLSAIGCLGVLLTAIKDDCDMEVSKTAVKITQRLVDLFKKYNVRSDCSAPTSPLPTENGMSATVSMSSGISVDDSMDSPSSHPDLNEEIIDQIVNSKDVSLLKSVYAPSDYGSVSNYDIQVRKIVSPNEFLQFTQQDLNAIIAEKKKWLNGIEDLGSLLDDMLKTYDDDVNNMDCY